MSDRIETVRPDQRWRRKKDGVLTKIISVDSPMQFRRSVHHQAQRRTITEFGSFLKKYEFAVDAVEANTPTPGNDPQLQQKLNTTREDILVVPDQIWEDLDTRQGKRRVVVVSVKSGRAQVRAHYGTRRSTLSVSRMHKHSTGFRLVKPGELKYGAPTASSNEETQR
ncbi:hypothetical protein [Streptomyces brevispora]|uniref:hypothetical protein n=1 Tax=Streptomyces brevispora TaxID=887462 RepID=UPI00381BD3AD